MSHAAYKYVNEPVTVSQTLYILLPYKKIQFEDVVPYIIQSPS